MESLGYIYIETINSNKKSALEFIEDILNNETKATIKDTFLNPKIQSSKNSLSLVDFIDNVTIEVSSYLNLKIEYISASLLIDKKKICSDNKIKFSLDKDNKTTEDSSFYNILNRNFCQLLNKSIYFTHGLDFEDGEVYGCLSLLSEDRLKPLLENIKESNISFRINNELKDNLLLGVLKKAIQDTIEEKSVLHFLNITKNIYLNGILDKITITNNSLNKLNLYLLATPNKNNFLESHDFDEEDIEVFVQNLLGSIPKFHNIESKIKETYYIKIGNTTTSIKVEESETIIKTFFYSKWKASIKYFIDTVNNTKESLNIYHQNKNLKELEDISYNANYQADIEDIRDLKNGENSIFNDKTKNYISLILFVFAIITLVGEAPLYKNIIPICTKSILLEILSTIGTNLPQHFVNIILYSFLLFILFFPFIKKHLKINLFKQTILKNEPKKQGIYTFEDSDYDKHEHRSNKSIYTLKNGKDKKVTVSYNDVVSAYSLMKQLKAKKITKSIEDKLNKFSIFPELLQKTLIDIDYLYRENYRISRNDKVTTKIMFRYKITNISLSDFMRLLNQDDFLKYYISYISKENIKDDFSKERLINSLKIGNWNSKDVELNLYIVYSFILKLNQINKNSCDYSVVKDQFRVHYHINQLHYTTQEHLEEQQESLAQLIYIYFLARLKKFA